MSDWNDPNRWLGVCPELARRFGWDVWAIRAVFVIALLVAPLWAIGAYLLLALLLPRPETRGSRITGGPAFRSDALRERERRIADLERRFRDLERRG